MVDVIILGAGAAGCMCAIEAGKRGRSVLLLERNLKIGEKIRISGGGRCNFTNVVTRHEHYLSENPHFCKSALARFTPDDIIALIERHAIKHHEKKLGQLFCDESSRQVIGMLEKECRDAGVETMTGCMISEVRKEDRFIVATNKGKFESASLVIATGGLSIPKLGATDFGLKLARQFGLSITSTKPGLVPLVFTNGDLKFFKELAGVSADAVVSCNGQAFRENILFTHRGLSGPAILQISSYWNPGDSISINLSPDVDLLAFLKENHDSGNELTTVLADILPRRLSKQWCDWFAPSQPMNRYPVSALTDMASRLHNWELTPSGTEGYQKAEVTCGGVDTRELSSKTMEVQKVPGLFVIGEVVDVTGHLGGYNFQWAWASGYVAGQYV